MPDLIITGLPRSGLTVAAALVDSLPDSLCLNAPKWQYAQARRESVALAYAKWLAGDFAWHRAQALRLEPIMDIRAADGSALFDTMLDVRKPVNEAGETEPVAVMREGLSRDFLLAMKQPLLYTAVLPELVGMGYFGFIAVIRNPLDVIASWQKTGGFPKDKENPPRAMTYWPEAAKIVMSDHEELDRMVQLYDLYIQRYYELREHIRILKYEDMVQNPAVISRILGKDVPPKSERIEPRSSIRMASQTDPIRASFKKYGVYTKHYYPDV